MKLREVTVHKFRSLENLRLSFEDALGNIQPLTVIAGPNGCGKTSLLFAIIQALRGLFKYRTDDVPEPTDLDIHRRESGAYFTKTPPQIQVELRLEFATAEKEAIRKVWHETEEPGRLTDDATSPSLREEETTMRQALPAWEGTAAFVEWIYPPPIGRGGTKRPFWFVERVTPREALHWFEGRRRAIRGALDGVLKDPTLLDQIGGPLIFPQDRSLRARVTGVSSGGVDTEREPSVWEILKDLGQRASSPSLPSGAEEGRLKEFAQRSEERIKLLFAQVCAPKEYLGFVYTPMDPLGSPYFRDGGSHYPLAMASSGEQVILEYIVRLTFPNTLNHGLILIDEPEAHLHPGWVRQLYRALPQLGEDNQFIVTTHSAEFRQMAAEDNVLIDLGDLQR